jgi:pyruvate,water dikinase
MNPIKRAWQRLTGSSTAQPSAALAARYAHFQRLLAANNRILTLMSDMEEKLSGEFLFDLAYINTSVAELLTETRALIEALNGLGENRYDELRQVLARLEQELQDILHRRREIPVGPLVVDFRDLDLSRAAAVGGKNANLGEVLNRVGLPVPPGFAVSTYAYKLFLEYNQLGERLGELLKAWSLSDLDSLARVSEELKAVIHAAQVPPELETALKEAYDRLCAQVGERPFLAVRSSAVGEDLTLTFAGQYATYLNVPPQDLVRRYKDILASLFTPRALFYYKNKGFNEEEMAMGVAVMPLIPARASGVLFTRHPETPEREVLLISAVWGLGRYAVGGVINPDQYVVAYDPPGEVVQKTIPPKPVKLGWAPEGGETEMPVPPAEVAAPCLGPEHLAQLADWARRLEAHYQKPQDVEWALDESGRLWLLQSRPLRVQTKREGPPRPRTLKGHRVLLSKGQVACRGVGAGPVVMVRQEKDLKNFPPGGVLVARHTSPKFVTVMRETAAIITDGGSVTGHMALLAREFQVPTIINTGNATKVLTPGQEVTVDANFCNVYEGLIPELVSSEGRDRDELADSPVFQTLKLILQKVIPLHLINPQAESFTPANCRTIHDLVRFSHEYSMREMFRMTELELGDHGEVAELEGDIPLKLRLLDLGGGLKRRRRRVRPEDIQSIPFQAFYQGLKAMPWPKAPPREVKALSSVFVKGEAELAQGASPWQDLSYVVLAKNYMNFSIRLGYHLSTVEAYVSDMVNDNYLTFSFRGGGSTPERRERRVHLIETLVDHMDLHPVRKGDLIEARLAKYEAQEMCRRLMLLGKLTVYTKQLDMVLFSDGIVAWYIKDFIREHLKGEAAEGG